MLLGDKMKEVEVVASATIYKNKVLLTQRTDGQFKDLWEFPGGKVESGETHFETIIREMNEELQVTVRPIEPLTTVTHQYPTFHLTMHVVITEIIAGEVTLTEHASYQWVSQDKLDHIDWVPADIAVIDPLKLYLSNS